MEIVKFKTNSSPSYAEKYDEYFTLYDISNSDQHVQLNERRLNAMKKYRDDTMMFMNQMAARWDIYPKLNGIEQEVEWSRMHEDAEKWLCTKFNRVPNQVPKCRADGCYINTLIYNAHNKWNQPFFCVFEINEPGYYQYNWSIRVTR